MKILIKILGIGIVSALSFFAGASVVSAQAVLTTCTGATLNGTVTPNGSSTNAWFEWGTNYSTVSNGGGTRTPTQTFTSNSSYSQLITGLSPNTTYYYRAVAQNAGGTARGSVSSFSTPSCGSDTPTTPTTNTVLTTCTGATLNGTVTPNGSSTNAWFEWGTNYSTVSNGGGTRTPTQTFTSNSSYSQLITGLSPNTTYYYRAVAQNAGGTARGSVSSFSTPSCGSSTAPTLTLSADQSSVTSGNGTYIRWYPTDATSCNATGGANGWIGSRSTSAGSFYTGSLNTTTTYNLTCSNSAGSVSRSVTVSVSGGGSNPTINTNSATNLGSTYATLNGVVDGNGLTTTAWFEWGTSSSFGNSTSQNSYGTGSTNYNMYLAGLSPNTTYYYRAVAQTSQGVIYGSTVSFTTNYGGSGSQPTVSTNSATSLGQSYATLNGVVNGNGLSTSAWFEWGTSPSFGNSTSQSLYGTGSTNYNMYLSGLSSNTTYYYRAVAQNSQGTVYGNTVSFTTTYSGGSGSQPTVNTISATNVSQNSATLNGFVNGNGYYASAWFEWGTTYSFGNTTSQNGYGNVSTNYNMNISGLASNTTYYYRAIAQTSQGTVYGNTLSFTTVSGGYVDPGTGSAPTAITTLATQLTGSSAQLNSLIFTSSNASTNAWFEWGTNAGLGYRTPSVSVGSLPTVRHADTITGLTNGTTYYYRVVAENPYSKSYGLVMSFVAGGSTTVINDTNVVINQKQTKTTHARTTVVNQGVGEESLVVLTINGGSESITAGESRTYHVEWKNVSDQNLRNVVLRILLPASMTFNQASRGVFTPQDNTLTLDIQSLMAGETGSLTFTATVSRTINEGELVVVVANLVYTTPANIQGDALAYATHHVERAPILAGASIFGSGSFLPTTLFGWLLLIILIFVLIFLAEHLYGRFTRKP